MTEIDVINLLRNTILITAKVSAPPLLVGLVVGLIVSILQTTTSIQEQTLTFVPKVMAVGITIILFLSWMLQNLMDFTREMFSIISRL